MGELSASDGTRVQLEERGSKLIPVYLVQLGWDAIRAGGAARWCGEGCYLQLGEGDGSSEHVAHLLRQPWGNVLKEPVQRGSAESLVQFTRVGTQMTLEQAAIERVQRRADQLWVASGGDADSRSQAADDGARATAPKKVVERRAGALRLPP